MGKNQPANAGDARDVGSTPGSGRSPEVGDGNPLWKIAWTEEPGRLQSMGSQRVRQTEGLSTHTHTHTHTHTYTHAHACTGNGQPHFLDKRLNESL